MLAVLSRNLTVPNAPPSKILVPEGTTMGDKAETKTPPSRLKFTKAGLAKLPIPASGRQYHYDTVQPGLTICVSSAGGRVFYVYKWVSGKPERIRLGTFPDLSVENARDLAKRIT